MDYKPKDQVRLEDQRRLMQDRNTPKSTDMTNFEAACDTFRSICEQIKTFAGLETFRGGFEEALAFLNSEAFINDKLTGTYLFSLWQGADKSVTYEASKVGIGQPDWWKKCWEIVD